MRKHAATSHHIRAVEDGEVMAVPKHSITSRRVRAAQREAALVLYGRSWSFRAIADHFGRTTSWAMLACKTDRPKRQKRVRRVICRRCQIEFSNSLRGKYRIYCDVCRFNYRVRRPPTRIPCRECGAPTTYGRCRDCGRKATAFLKAQRRRCVVCDIEFTPRSRDQKCCKAACQQALCGQQQIDRVMREGTSRWRTFVCAGCGQNITRRLGDKDIGKYCRKSCPGRLAATVARREQKRAARILRPGPCACCGGSIPAGRRAYCSDSCVANHWEANHPHYARDGERRRRGIDVELPRICVTCGVEFQTDDMRRRFYCSTACGRRSGGIRELIIGHRPEDMPKGYIEVLAALKTLRREIALKTGAIR